MGITAAVLAGTSVVSSLYGAQKEAEAIGFQSELEQIQIASNARIRELQAEQVLKKGDKDVLEFQKRAVQLKGSQRAALAAQGIDIESGSAAEAMSQTDEIILQDSVTIKNNAMFEALGLRQAADQDRLSGYLGGLQSKRRRQTTLVAGGLSAVSSAASYGVSSGAFKKFFSKSGVKGED